MRYKIIGEYGFFLILSTVIIFGCAHRVVQNKAISKNSQTAITKDISQKGISRDYVVVKFKEGSDTLATKSAEEIHKLLERKKPFEKIDRVEVAAWSDHTAPEEKLLFSQGDQSLAQQRVDKISNYLLSQFDLHNLRVFNLVEVNNDDFSKRSEIKSRAFYSKKDISLPATQDFDLFKEKGGPSKAVIIVTRNSPAD